MQGCSKAQLFNAGNDSCVIKFAFIIVYLGLVGQEIDRNLLHSLHAAYNLFNTAGAGAAAHACDI